MKRKKNIKLFFLIAGLITFASVGSSYYLLSVNTTDIKNQSQASENRQPSSTSWNWKFDTGGDSEGWRVTNGLEIYKVDKGKMWIRNTKVNNFGKLQIKNTKIKLPPGEKVLIIKAAYKEKRERLLWLFPGIYEFVNGKGQYYKPKQVSISPGENEFRDYAIFFGSENSPNLPVKLIEFGVEFLEKGNDLIIDRIYIGPAS